jgi:hypothetical protein
MHDHFDRTRRDAVKRAALAEPAPGRDAHGGLRGPAVPGREAPSEADIQAAARRGTSGAGGRLPYLDVISGCSDGTMSRR